MPHDALQLQPSDVMLGFLRFLRCFFNGFAYYMVMVLKCFEGVFFWQIDQHFTGATAPRFRACRTGLQRNACFFKCRLLFRNSDMAILASDKHFFDWTLFLERWSARRTNIFFSFFLASVVTRTAKSCFGWEPGTPLVCVLKHFWPFLKLVLWLWGHSSGQARLTHARVCVRWVGQPRYHESLWRNPRCQTKSWIKICVASRACLKLQENVHSVASPSC